jgi:pimeloyl-ACP methyl ester carboxylesterase
MTSPPFPRRAVTLAAALLVLALAAPATAPAAQEPGGDGDSAALQFTPCADGFECATLTVPLDYTHRSRGTLALPVVRKPATDPARRLGSLLVNFGGPGDATTESLLGGGIDAFAGVNDRYDVVGWDPRGTGGTDAIDCDANLEQIGPIVQPFPRPDTLDRGRLINQYQAYNTRCVDLNPRVLPFVTTGNSARDMDRLRAGLGEDRIDYLGYSYGTFLGATYETLFPDHVGRFVLDGALDANEFLTDPIHGIRQQTKAFEVELGRFFQACAADQAACLDFGGKDPWAAYDVLVDQLNATPIPGAPGSQRVVDGDDILAGSLAVLGAKFLWPLLAEALATASQGDGTLAQLLVDAFYGRLDDGTFDPFFDRFYAITSTEMQFPRNNLDAYFKLGAEDFDLFDHFWWNSGYFDLAQALWPVKPQGAFLGPFKAPGNATPTLVVGTTYDPATPYKGAKRLVNQLGNARLLTMRGDGHTAYPGNSPCIDVAVEAYLEDGVVPPPGVVCVQDVPFEQPAAATPTSGAGTRRLRQALRQALQPHTKPQGAPVLAATP